MECPKAKPQTAENSVPLADACCWSWLLLLGHISTKMPLLDEQCTQLFQAGEAVGPEVRVQGCTCRGAVGSRGSLGFRLHLWIVFFTSVFLEKSA